MVTKPKANSIVTHQLTNDGRIRFTIRNNGELSFDPQAVSTPNRARAELHGWLQRIVDAAAISMTDKDGNIIPAADRDKMKYDAMRRVIAHYESGAETWNLNVAREGGIADTGIIREAIARHFKWEPDTVNAKLDKYAGAKFEGDTGKCLRALSKHVEIAKIILAIRAERLAKQAPVVDTDAMMDEFAAD